jgi:hypothetical protein
MRFGIDIDGVIADFISAYVREVNDVWPGKIPIGYQPPDWDWTDVLTQEEITHVWKIIKHKHNWWLSLPPDAQNLRAVAMHRIRHPQDEIFFVTARVSTKGMPVMHQTQVWLSECGINGLGVGVIVDHSNDKSAIFNALECDANIDDRLSTVIDHAANTKGAYLLDRSWNRQSRPEHITTVSSLEEFFRDTRRYNVASS